MGAPLCSSTPMYTLYHVGIYWVYPLSKGAPTGRVKQLGYHRKGTTIFPLFQNIPNAITTFG